MVIECLKACLAACCRGSLYLNLTSEEASDLQSVNTTLAPTNRTVGLPNGQNEYYRSGACGLLDENNQCEAHDNEVIISSGFLGLFRKKIERPKICEDFKPESPSCLNLRRLNPLSVKKQTPADIHFDEWYNSQ